MPKIADKAMSPPLIDLVEVHHTCVSPISVLPPSLENGSYFAFISRKLLKEPDKLLLFSRKT